jgi:hypothetical protein
MLLPLNYGSLQQVRRITPVDGARVASVTAYARLLHTHFFGGCFFGGCFFGGACFSTGAFLGGPCGVCLFSNVTSAS